MMKIAICAGLELGGAGGVEVHIRELAEALVRAGAEVAVFGRHSGPTYRSLEEFEPGRYNIIHTHGSAFCSRLASAPLKRLPRQRHIHTLHGVSLDYLIGCGSWWNWRIFTSTLIEGMCSRYADHVIAVSESIKKRAQQCFALHPEKISVIGNGFNPAAAAFVGREQIRRRLGLGVNETVLLFVGRGADRVKGAAAISAAVNQLIEKYPNLRLLAVPGDGFKEANWLRRSGCMEHAQMHGLYEAADIFVNASLNEGMPITLVEAMAAGRAIVAAPVGGIVELISHNRTGLLLRKDRTDLAEQLGRLIESADLRRMLGNKARKSIQKLTWDNLARQTINVYESCINRIRI